MFASFLDIIIFDIVSCTQDTRTTLRSSSAQASIMSLTSPAPLVELEMLFSSFLSPAPLVELENVYQSHRHSLELDMFF